MSNKERALARLKYRIEALADRFDKASDNEATDVAKKINIYGRLAEVLRNEIAIEKAEENKPAQDAPKPVNTFGAPEPYPVSYGSYGHGQYGIRGGEDLSW